MSGSKPARNATPAWPTPNSTRWPRGPVRSFSLRDPGNRFFHLQNIVDSLERAELREKNGDQSADPEASPAVSPSPPLKGQTVFLANALTGGGNEYLIGGIASESDAWLASQRELNQGRKVWIEPHAIGLRASFSSLTIFWRWSKTHTRPMS